MQINQSTNQSDRDEINRVALESPIAEEMIELIEQSKTGQYGCSYCNHCGAYIVNEESPHKDSCDYINFVSKISKLRERNHD